MLYIMTHHSLESRDQLVWSREFRIRESGRTQAGSDESEKNESSDNL